MTAADVSMAALDGTQSKQAVGATSFVTLQLDTEASDPGGNFNNTSATVGGVSPWCYRVPSSGLYLALAKVRPVDSTSNAVSQLGVGVHTSSADNPDFQWGGVQAGTAAMSRQVFGYSRLATFNAGDQLRLFVWASSAINISSAKLAVIRVA
jgi:hypothetical protein